MTEKLYDKDAYLSSFTATVLSCERVANGYAVVLDRTAFFPEGGGQAADGGSLDSVAVLDVKLREGTVVHTVEAPLIVGASVLGRIDWPERFRRMQNHSGEHVLSGVVHKAFGYENVGFHLGDREMTVDYSGPLTAEDLRSVETAANRAVWENRIIRCEYPSREVLKALPYRSKKELSGEIRIVTVDGVDVCACCAPHVKSTGEIGGIVIVEALNWKGGTRLKVRCGSDALDEYAFLRADESDLSRLLSAPRGQIAEVAQKLKVDYEELRREFGALQRDYWLLQVNSLPETKGNLCFFTTVTDGEVLRSAALAGLDRCDGLFLCLSGNDDGGYRYCMASSSVPLRRCAKQINADLRGKGGGDDALQQGRFSATAAEIRAYFEEKNILGDIS